MTPEEQEAVRRALAAAPPAGPMPPEVVARLEATIADLAAVRAAERSGTEAPPAAAGTAATVSDLEGRRRRRWPQVLVAAASVAVIGYGVGMVAQDAGQDAGQHEETAASDSAGEVAAEDERAGSGADGGAAAPQAPGTLAEGPVVELGEATLRRDVVRHLRADRSAVTAEGLAELDANRYSRRDGTCVVPEVRAGDDVWAALFDGRRATLVVRRAEDGARVAEVYWCGDGRTLLAETEVPARR